MSLSIGDAVLRIVGDTKDVEQKVAGLASHLKIPGGKKLLLGMAGGIAAVGLSAVKGTTSAAKFQDSMLNTRTIAKMSDEDFASLSQKVLDLSKKFPETTGGADQLADALYQAVSSGIPAANAMDFLSTAAEGATAGATDTATVVQALAGTLNAYHLNADKARHVSDVLFQTVNLGVVDMGTLSSVMSNVSAVAAAAGVSLEETGAGIATLTKQNIPAAEATTDLRSAIEAIVNANGPMLKALKKQGYESGVAALKSLGLEGTLNLLSKGVGNNTAKWFELIPRIEGVQAALGLTGKNAKGAKADFDAMAKASDGAGAAHAAFEVKEKGLSDTWEHLMSVMHAGLIQTWQALIPVATKLLNGIIALFNGTSPLSPLFHNVATAVQRVIGFFVSMGPVIMGIATSVAPIVKQAIQGIVGVFSLFGGKVDSASSSLPSFKQVLSGVASFIQAVMPTVSAIFSAVFGLISNVVRAFTTYVLPVLLKWLQQIIAWVQAHWSQLSAVFQIVLAVVKMVVTGFISTLNLLLDAVMHVWPAIQAVIETVMSVISGIINVFLDIITGKWGKVWPDIKAMLVGVWNGILKFIAAIPSLIIGILEGLLVAAMVWAGAFAGKLLGWAGGFVGRFVGWFAKLPGRALGAIGGLPGRLLGFLGGLLKRVVGWLGDLVGKFVKFFADTPGKAMDALSSLPTKIINFLLGIPGKIAHAALDIGKHIVSGIVSGVEGAIGGAISNITGAVGGVVGGVLNFLGIHSPSTVFADIGRQSMAGLAVGLANPEEPMAALQRSVQGIIRSNPLALVAKNTGAVAASAGGEGAIHIHGPIYLPDVTDATEFVSGLRHMANTRSSTER